MIRLRPAEPQDMWTFYELRRQEQPDLTMQTHEEWWNDEWEHRFVAHDGPATVGTVRISVSEDRIGEGVVSIIVARTERGKGLGTQMLTSIQRIGRDLNFTHLTATVEEGNTASQRAFGKAGWVPVRFGVTLMLLGALCSSWVSPVQAEDDWYESGTVLLHMPVKVTSPGSAEIFFQIPVKEYYITESPSFRSCNKWTKNGVHGPWDAQSIPILDHYVTITPSYKTDYKMGTRVFVVSDASPEGRVQWFCVRLPFVRMEE